MASLDMPPGVASDVRRAPAWCRAVALHHRGPRILLPRRRETVRRVSPVHTAGVVPLSHSRIRLSHFCSCRNPAREALPVRGGECSRKKSIALRFAPQGIGRFLERSLNAHSWIDALKAVRAEAPAYSAFVTAPAHQCPPFLGAAHVQQRILLFEQVLVADIGVELKVIVVEHRCA